MFRKIKIKFVMNFLQHEMATLDQYWNEGKSVNNMLDAYNNVLIDLQNKKRLGI